LNQDKMNTNNNKKRCNHLFVWESRSSEKNKEKKTNV